MQIKNSKTRYGLVTVALHWLVAVTVIGQFALGLWMVDLDYYDTWYKTGPDLHRSVGMLLFLAMLLRLFWRMWNISPEPLASHSVLEHLLAGIAHRALYLLLFLVMLSGYFISTADGRPLDVFGWFAVPAIISGIEGQEDIAGIIHLVLAITLVSFAGLHALAALKHHIVDRDTTLYRMLGK